MLDDELKLIIESIIEQSKYWGGGFKMTSGAGGKMSHEKKPLIWGKKGLPPNPEKERSKVAAVTDRNKRIRKSLERHIAKKKVIPFPKQSKAEPMKKVLKAGLDLSNYLEYILNDQRQFDHSGQSQGRKSLKKAGVNPDREIKLSTARQRQLQQMKKFEAQRRSKEKQKAFRKQKVIASIGR